MMRLKGLLTVFCILIIFYRIAANTNDSPAGLSFNSNDKLIEARTSYEVFNDFKRIKGDSVALEFDLSFIDVTHFGYILNLYNKSDEYFNVVLVHFRDRDSIYLDFNAVKSNVKLSIPLPINKCKRTDWHRMRLCLDFAENKISFNIDGTGKSADYDFNGRKKEMMKCVFGLSPKYTDVPAIMIKDVHFFDGKQWYIFPLNEFDGEIVHDLKGRSTGNVKNPVWCVGLHYYWEKTFSAHQNVLCGIAHDTKRHNIVIFNSDSTYIYDIGKPYSPAKYSNDFTKNFKYSSGGLFYNSYLDKFIIYEKSPHADDEYSIAEYDYDKRVCIPFDLITSKIQFHHYNFFTGNSSEIDDIYIFGGYHDYRYTNSILKYQSQSHSWAVAKFKGDTITPRFFAACGENPSNPNIKYIFGGFGNLSGKQEDGGNNLYDFFQIDLKNKVIKKIFDIHHTKDDFVPARELIMMPEEECFYVLCYNHNIPNTKGYIYKFNINDGRFIQVSDEVPIVSEKIESNVHFYYDSYYQMMLCVTQEYKTDQGVIITISTLDYPPYPLNSMSGKETGNRNWMLLPFVGLIVILVIIWSLIRNKKKIRKFIKSGFSRSSSEVILEGKQIIQNENHHNSIYLMGDFCVCERTGRDISFRFSSKIRQLFFLILLNTYSKGHSISSEEISAILWPEKENSKNIRGVTIKYLRDILIEIDGIKLVNEKGKWRFEVDNKVCICDYIQIVSLSTEQIMTKMDEDNNFISDLLKLFNRGVFLNAYNFPWLDPFKYSFEEHTTRLLMPLLRETFRRKNYSLALQLANCLLLVDPLNEDVFKTELKILQFMGKHEQAKLKFQIFAKEYNKSYGKIPSEKNFL